MKVALILAGLVTGAAFAAAPWDGTIRTSDGAKTQWAKMAKIKFTDALNLAAKQNKGDVIDVQLDEERGFLVYEVTVIDSRGTQTELTFDAGDGRLLGSRIDD